jgi:FkbM family methyltransferase
LLRTMRFKAQAALLELYRFANHSGFMKNPVFQKLYWNAYCTYKRKIEDPFYNLRIKHPELFKGGHILDVGANIGYTTTVFAELLEPPFKLIAFEPEPENFISLKKHINKLSKAILIQAEPLALGSQKTTVTLSLNPDHPSDHKVVNSNLHNQVNCIPVDQDTLDNYCTDKAIINNIRFIKIDVQGYELEVCRGANEIIMQNDDVIFAVEFDMSAMKFLGFCPEKLLIFFREYGFTSYIIKHSGDLLRFSNIYDTVLDRGYVDILFKR